MIPDSLIARPGQGVRGALRRFQRFVQSESQFQVGAGMRRHRSITGSAVVADSRPAAFRGAFAVTISGSEAVVGPGEIDGITPRIAGQLIHDPANPAKIPKLKISPGENNRSFIVLVATPSDEGNSLDPEDESAAVIEHRATLSVDGDDPRSAVKALAVIEWAGTSAAAGQIVFFNQRLGSENGKPVILPAA